MSNSAAQLIRRQTSNERGSDQPVTTIGSEQVRRSTGVEMSSKGHEHSALVDIALGLIAGLTATQVTNLAQGPLKRFTPDRVREQEEKVRPGASSSLVAARKIVRSLNVSPSQREEELWGTAIHFATGIAWGPVYGLLRRYGKLHPVSAALGSGFAMSLILDEGLVPALGLSAPSHHYLPHTRARGFIAHLTYGIAAGLAAEGLGRLVQRPLGPAATSWLRAHHGSSQDSCKHSPRPDIQDLKEK